MKPALDRMGTEDASDPIDVLVDEAGMDSFPASDPPSYWARNSAETYGSRVEVADDEEENVNGDELGRHPKG